MKKDGRYQKFCGLLKKNPLRKKGTPFSSFTFFSPSFSFTSNSEASITTGSPCLQFFCAPVSVTHSQPPSENIR
jgi:hypothetical protein